MCKSGRIQSIDCWSYSHTKTMIQAKLLRNIWNHINILTRWPFSLRREVEPRVVSDRRLLTVERRKWGYWRWILSSLRSWLVRSVGNNCSLGHYGWITLLGSKHTSEITNQLFCFCPKMQFQACALVLDDIMDDPHTRRDQICWHKRPEVLKSILPFFLLSRYIWLYYLFTRHTI
jgi:hypothetical protein